MQINADNYINTLFGYYDKIITPYPLNYQAAISALLLVFLIWNIYVLLKNGHWLWILILILAIPATWPALKKVADILYLILKGILYRIQH